MDGWITEELSGDSCRRRYHRHRNTSLNYCRVLSEDACRDRVAGSGARALDWSGSLEAVESPSCATERSAGSQSDHCGRDVWRRLTRVVVTTGRGPPTTLYGPGSAHLTSDLHNAVVISCQCKQILVCSSSTHMINGRAGQGHSTQRRL